MTLHTLPRAARLDTLMASFEAAMRTGQYEKALDFARAADALAWRLCQQTGPLTERAELARILKLEEAA